MKVTSILGSPRRGGNTAAVLARVEGELRASGHEVERIDLLDLNINGCKECYHCQSVPDAPGCPQRDDAGAIFARMLSADAVLLASPVFCWGFTAQMKALMDRTFCLAKGYPEVNSLIEGKRVALVTTCGGSLDENADLITAAYERWAEYGKCRSVGTLAVPGCTTPEEIDPEVGAQAQALARALEQ